jgi:hypothetical protein
LWDGLDSYGSEQGPVERSCERSNEPSGSINRWEIIEFLSDWRLPKRAQLHVVS